MPTSFSKTSAVGYAHPTRYGRLAGRWINEILRVGRHRPAMIAFQILMEVGSALPENDYVVISTVQIAAYGTHALIKRPRLPSPIRYDCCWALRSDLRLWSYRARMSRCAYRRSVA